MPRTFSTSASPILAVLRNEQYTPGRSLTLGPYQVTLSAPDVAAGITVAAVYLLVMAAFGQAPTLSVEVTPTAQAQGQITDDGATDGEAGFYLELTPDQTDALVSPCAFEVVIVLSDGRQGTWDRGALVAAPGADLIVGREPVDHVVVSPDPASVAAGLTTQLSATPFDAANAPLGGRVITWQSSDITVATVNASGLVTGVAQGDCIITATCEGHSDTSALTVTALPGSPDEFAAQFNALGKGVLDGLYVVGINETVVPDAGSPTGFYCTFWDDARAAAAGLGKHFRPAAGFPSGAPCLADGTVVGEGLEIPAVAGFGLPVADVTVPSHPVGMTAVYDGEFGDYTKGRTWGLVSKLANTVPYLMIGENDGTGYLYTGGDQFRYYGIGGADHSGQPGGSAFPANQLAVHALVHLKWTDSTGNIAPLINPERQINLSRLSRDIIYFTVPDNHTVTPIPDLTINGAKRIRLLPSSLGGVAADQNNAAVSCVYFIQGRADAAAQQLLHDWVESKPWGAAAWNDPLPNWLGYCGDSYQDVILGEWLRVGLIAGAPVLANTRIMPGSSDFGAGYSFGGRGVIDYCYPMLGWTARDMDTSRRTKYVWVTGEWLNAGNTATTLQANKELGKAIKALSPKFRCILRDDQNGWNSAGSPSETYNADLVANAVSGGSADRLERISLVTNFDQYHWQDGPPNKRLILWKDPAVDGAQHPNDFGQRMMNEFQRLGILAETGTDISNLSAWVAPSADSLDLTVGDPPTSVTWTPKTYNGLANATGKTLSFTSANPAVATVDPATGAVTAVASGQTSIECHSSDGACGVLVVNVTAALVSDGSPEDVISHMQAAGLTLDSFWDLQRGVTLAGANVASVDDARGAGAGPQLTPQNATAIPYDAVNKLATIDGGAELGTALDARYDLSVAGRFFFFLGTIEGVPFGAVAVKTATDTYSISDASGKWSLATTFTQSPVSAVALTGVTPFLAALEAQFDAVSGQGFVGIRALNEWIKATGMLGLLVAGNARISLGATRIKLRGFGIGRGGSLPVSVWQSLDRWRNARGGTATLDGTKALAILGNTNASGAGTTAPATDAWSVKLLAQLPAAYKMRVYDFMDRVDKVVAMGEYLATRQIDPTTRTVHWIWIETGLFDEFTGQSAAAEVTAIGNFCQALKALGVTVRVGVSTVWDNNGTTEAGHPYMQTLNNGIRALVGAGKADAVLDYQAHGWSTAGNYFDTATSTLIANAIFALMSGVGV